ncbi:MAG: HAMP domain-containing histidine kinase, partial [Myxococcales bacterium]|nr:HAMP domain-containing histidine kinase [Myxococcales bacterium]
GDLADLLAAGLHHAASPAQRERVLSLVRTDPYLDADLRPARAASPWATADDTARDAEGSLLVRLGEQRFHLAERALGHAVLRLAEPASLRPPVRAPDDAPAMLLLTLLVLGAPVAAWLLADDAHRQLGRIAQALARIGNAGDSPGVPVSTVDEIGDLAVAINTACGRFAEVNRHLIDELRAAASNDRARTGFLRTASHELRTPLDTIKGYCHLLGRTDLTEAQREDVRVIAQASEQLLAHVDEILDLSAIEAGDEAPLQPEPIDLAALAREIIDGYAERTAPEVTPEVIAAPDAPRALADAQRVRQILANLISNALKFTEAGFVEVGIAPGYPEAGRPTVHLRVTDSGPGIPADELEAIFEEFHRVEQQRDVPGTGLGLAIARRLVERHGGRLWAESAPGEGSVFHLVLPAEGAS